MPHVASAPPRRSAPPRCLVARPPPRLLRTSARACRARAPALGRGSRRAQRGRPEEARAGLGRGRRGRGCRRACRAMAAARSSGGERGGVGGDQVSACPSAHHKSSHTHDFLLSLTLGQPRSSPGDFLFCPSMGQNHRLTSGEQYVTVLLVSNLVTQIYSDSISFFDKFLSWAT